MNDDPRNPEADTFLIVGPEHMLGDAEARRRIAEEMAELFPGARFMVTASAPVLDEIAIVPVMATVGEMPGGQAGDLRRTPAADRLQEMHDTLERLARASGRTLN